MNYEEQILELKKRIEVLEKAEKKRILKRKREIIFKIVKFFVVTGAIVFGCYYVYNSFILPYKEKIDQFEKKVNGVEDFITDEWGTIKDWLPFS